MEYWDGFIQTWPMPLIGGLLIALGGFFILILVLWSIFWKGMALWKAARQRHKYWFIALLLINTLGILEILYIYFFSKKIKLVHEK